MGQGRQKPVYQPGIMVKGTRVKIAVFPGKSQALADLKPFRRMLLWLSMTPLGRRWTGGVEDAHRLGRAHGLRDRLQVDLPPHLKRSP